MIQRTRVLVYKLLLLVDLALVLGAFVVARQLIPVVRGLLGYAPPPDLGAFRDYAWLLLLMWPLWLFFLHAFRLDAPLRKRPYWNVAWALAKAGTLSTLFLTGILFAAKLDPSRLLIFVSGCLATAALILEKWAVKAVLDLLHRRGYNRRNVLLIGSRSRAQEILERMQREGEISYHIQGCLEIDSHLVGQTVGGIPIVGTVDQYREIMSRFPSDEVVVAMPMDLIPNLAEILEFCEEIGITAHLLPDYQVLRYRRKPSRARPVFEAFLGLPVISFSVTPTQAGQLLAKRCIDFFGAAAGLVHLAPLFAIIAVAIKLTSRGPVFYRWPVLGLNGREFTGYKFRTMVEDADRLKTNLLKGNAMVGPVFKMKEDPRVTPVGRILRKYSLDELPQLWNVLKGDMSLVGPRPPLRSEAIRYEFWHRRKLSVKPGITCIWQVDGRNEIQGFDEWVKLDLQYIDNWSLWLDFKILLKTIPAVLRGTGW